MCESIYFGLCVSVLLVSILARHGLFGCEEWRNMSAVMAGDEGDAC